MSEDLEKQGKAGEYINGTLKAVEPVNILSSPEGKIIRTVSPGSIIGTIESFIQDNGKVYWMLKDGTFVLHEGTKFDFPYLEKSILEFEAKKQAEIDKKVEERKENNSSTLYQVGKSVNEMSEFFSSNYKLILISVAVIVVLILIVKIKS